MNMYEPPRFAKDTSKTKLDDIEAHGANFWWAYCGYWEDQYKTVARRNRQLEEVNASIAKENESLKRALSDLAARLG